MDLKSSTRVVEGTHKRMHVHTYVPTYYTCNFHTNTIIVCTTFDAEKKLSINCPDLELFPGRPPCVLDPTYVDVKLAIVLTKYNLIQC
jgi:hypothetical protein